MKMTRETFDKLATTIAQYAEDNNGWPFVKAVYRLGLFHNADRVKNLWERFRWDILYMSGANKDFWDRWREEGLSDNHIDTALRRIVPDPTKPPVKILTPEWTDYHGEPLRVEPKDLAEVFRLIDERCMHRAPLVGDYLSDGRRIARIWRDSDGAKFQPTRDGSFFLLESGGDFSGGLDGPLPLACLTRTDKVRMARFWRFKSPAGPGRSWDFEVEVPVWKLKGKNHV